jgi:hypothetical protein
MPANNALLPVANQPKPGIGCGKMAPDTECAAVVLIVSVDVPELLATEVGANAHVGAGVPPPVTAHVSATVPVKPAVEPTVIVEVADPPAATEAGEIAPAEIVKSGVAGAPTARVTGEV